MTMTNALKVINNAGERRKRRNDAYVFLMLVRRIQSHVDAIKDILEASDEMYPHTETGVSRYEVYKAHHYLVASANHAKDAYLVASDPILFRRHMKRALNDLELAEPIIDALNIR